MNKQRYLLPYASIRWPDADTPYSPDFDDVYWSRAGALAEKQHVFIDGCDLPNRFSQLPGDAQFTVLETGFGFGINFFLTCRAWSAADPPAGSTLDYIACEQHLVTPQDLQKMAAALGLEPELATLLPHYPAPVPGAHSLWVAPNICLHLLLGDAGETLKQLSAAPDAVFLDGFSPSKNPALWHRNILSPVTSAMRPGARLCTYSVAGDLRRSLDALGMTVTKVAGFGQKRHMLLAEQAGDWQPQIGVKKHVAVVGAGLAGLLVAQALQQRGHKVTLLEQSDHPLGAVNRISQIAIYPQLSKTPQDYSNFYLRAFQYYLRHFELEACGRLELLTTSESRDYGAALAEQLGGIVTYLEPAEASEKLGLPVSHPALLTPSAGWVDPSQLAAELPRLKRSVTHLTREEDGWRIDGAESAPLFADVVVLTTGYQMLEPLLPLNLMALRGQSVRIRHPVSPRMVFSHAKTWFPAGRNGSVISGTYDRFDDDRAVRASDTQTLLDSLAPYLDQSPEAETAVGVRSATRDRMPVVDQLPDWQALSRYCEQAPPHTAFDAYQGGLYCSVGFGSHGGTLGPYCAELLARKISGAPLVEDCWQLSSIRFALRDARIKRAR